MGIETKLISTLTSAKTGTVVKKMLNSEGQLQKVIQYGEKTPLRQIGIDTVKITSDKNGVKTFDYFRQNCKVSLFTFTKCIDGRLGSSSYYTTAAPLVDHNSFQKTLKNFIDALRASKAMMG